MYNSAHQVFLVHPGGPFFKFNDKCWGIPKGIAKDDENPLQAGIREFVEETGIEPQEPYFDLGFVEYNNKRVYCWAFKDGNFSPKIVKSNLTKYGWPEIDKVEYFSLETARTKILPAQRPFLYSLLMYL